MAEALKWLTAAAQQDFALAIEETARLYFKIQRDYAQAYRWCSTSKAGEIPFCQTVLASHPESPNHYAQHMIGEMYLNGQGITQDIKSAKAWFEQAASQGYEPSRQKLYDIVHNPPVNSPTPQKKSYRWSALSLFGRRK
ncbi:hypothetical protein K492DRAFT_133459 [Lichtheimia hyalospora FSU 10163]|nr:hypothetical protein K492DRAFT_133459 [Lichtheimia hyalospora FSU 10163]